MSNSTIQKFLYSLLALLLINSIAFGQSNRSTRSPEVQSFALNPDLKGMGENSVNLYSGDVNLPVSLVNLPGRGGLDVNVTMSYNSNIQDKEDVWNKEAPTGILGLGWSMNYDKIVVDHKKTGNRHDDDFYLVTGGSSIELIQTGYNGNGKTYETKPYKFWKIIYFPSDERWEITKEDGKKYTFGGGMSYGSDGNKTSHRNTVQWGVKWGNWIGASGRTQGQQQHAIAWNLSKMRDRWGNEIKYTYDAVVEEVGRSGNPDYAVGLQHTKASYLSQITNPEGKAVRFVYEEKRSSGSLKEYYDPHTKPVPEKEIGVSISGPSYLTAGERGTWTASVEGGTAPYQYSWSYRYTGGSWISGGSGSSFSHYGQSGSLQIALTVEDAEGITGEANKSLFVQPDPGDCSGPRGDEIICPEPLAAYSTDTLAAQSIIIPPWVGPAPPGTITESNGYREPDAYQEKYETRYLDYVLVKNESDEELFTVDMSYDFNNDGQNKPPKRLLTSIEHIMPGGKSLPEMEFSYNNDSHNVHPSALKTVTYPTGSEVTYTYSEQILGQSNRKQAVSAPTSYVDPRVFIAGDYVVTTWRSGGSLKLKVYSWDGRWLEYEYGSIGYAGKIVNDLQNFEIFLEEDFFVLIDRFHEKTDTKKMYAFHQDPYESGNWVVDTQNLYFDNQRLNNSSVATGEDFFAVTDVETGKLYRYVWDGDDYWRYDYDRSMTSGGDQHFFIGGTNNYFVFDDEHASGPDELTIYYLDETQNWQTKNISTWITKFESDTEYSTDRNHIWADNSHFTILAHSTWESIFRLKENYGLTSVYNIGSLKDSAPVFNVANSIISPAPNSASHNPKAYRFDGVAWHNANNFLDNDTYSVGKDILVKREGYYGNGNGAYITYNPNLSTWSSSSSLSGPQNVHLFPEVGNNFFVFPDEAYYLNSYGGKTSLGGLDISGGGIDYSSIRAGLKFIAHQELSSGLNRTYIHAIKNGDFAPSSPFKFSGEYVYDRNSDYQQSNLVGVNTIVLSEKSSLSLSSEINLYRFINNEITGKQKDYPVTAIEVNNGYQVQETNFEHDLASATVDPSGSFAQYNKVTVMRGSDEGCTEHYFYNGEQSNDSDLLKGLPYDKKVRSMGLLPCDVSPVISETKNHWKIYNRDIENTGTKIAESTWIRQNKTESTVDGLKTMVTKTFDLETGQPTNKTTYGENGDTKRELYTYWWEKYDTDRSENLLTPVIQTEKKVNNTTTGLSATTWKDWGSSWGPHKAYQWKGSGSSTFNFANWSGSGEPNSNWLKISEINAHDSFGNVIQSTDVDGISSTRKWVENGTKLGAIFNNTKAWETWFVYMETFRNTNYGELADKLSVYKNGNGTLSYSSSSDPMNSSHQRVEVDNLTDRSAGVRLPLSGLTSGEEYILDFSYKLTQGKLNVRITGGNSSYSTTDNYSQKGSWKTARQVWTYDSGQSIYFRAPWNGSGASDVTFYLDNIRVYPADGSAKSYSYQARTGQTKSVIDSDNVPVYYQYDRMQRLGSIVDHKGRVLSQKGYFYSRSQNNGSFSTTSPNANTTVSYTDEEEYDNFSNSSGWSVSGSNIAFNTFKNGVQGVRMGTDGGWDTITKNAGSGDVIARVDFYSNSGTAGNPHVLYFDGDGERFGVHYISSSDQFRIQYRHNNGSWQYPFTFPLEASPGKWFTIEIVKRSNGTCEAWVYPKRGSRSEANAYSLGNYPTNWNPSIKSSSNDNYFWLANFYSGSFSESKQFTNGSGRTIQTQTWNGTAAEYIISHTEYDGMGREWKSWMPYIYGSGGNYDANFSSHADSYYGTSSSRLYSEKLYQANPLSRVRKIMPPANGTSGITRYYGNTFINGQKFAYTDETGLDGITNRTLRNPHLNKSRSISAYGTSNSVTSEQVADPINKTTESRPPHYFDPPGSSSASDWVTTTERDFLGRTIKVQTPDAGTVQNKYDETGKLRFTQDANQAASGLVGFTRYDALGRTIASGEVAEDFSTLDGSQNYEFETDQATQIQATAYDDKPSSGNFPWSLFNAELNGISLSNTHGKVAAEAFRTTGKSEAGSTLEGETITGSSTIETAGSVIVGPDYTIESGGSVTLRSGTSIKLKPGFHAKSGSDFHASIDPGLSTGSNSTDWQLMLHSYDEQGQLATKYIFTQDKPELDTQIEYTYSHLGEVTKQHVEIGSQHLYHFYEYDNHGQLARVYTNTSDSKPTNPEVTYTYNESGQLVDEDIYGQTKADINYSYDLKGRLAQLSNGDNSFTEDISYNSDGTIQNISFDNSAGSYGYTYSYDDLGRLQSADYSNGSTEFDVNNVTYDKHGNIKSLKRYFDPSLVDDLTYNHIAETNKLGSVSDAVASTGHDWDVEDASFTYDANGNMKTNTGKGVENIGYDTRNLPLSMSLDNDLQAIYRYNSEGWRTLKKVEDNGTTSVEEHYIMDDGTVLAVTDANGNIKHWNLYGNGLIARLEDTGTKKYYVRDHLGSTRQVVNESGTQLEYYDYYPFGLVLRSNVSGQETKETFTGKEQDPSTGYYYFGSRYYDAALAGWGTTDPAGQFASPYVYAGNPVSYTDPNGEFVLEAILIGAAIGGSLGAMRASRNEDMSIAGGIWRGALVGAAGGAIGSIGVGSSFAANLALGVGEGAATGVLDAGLFGGDLGSSALVGGVTGGVFATLTSPQLKNAVKGKGFRSNQKVFADFVEGGDYQGALDYFGFEGTYNPEHPYLKGNPEPAITDPNTGEIFYNDQPFEGNFDKFAFTAAHEEFHQQNVLSGKYKNVDINFEVAAREEWATYLHNYKNQGLYPRHGIDLSHRINSYGLQGGIYNVVATPTRTFSTKFNKKWWHFIYQIPRRY